MHSSWRGAVANLRKAVERVTPEQHKLAIRARIKLAKELPKIVAASRLKTALGDELFTDAVRQTSDLRLDALSRLNAHRARDSRVKADHHEAEAWITFYTLDRRRKALSRLRLEAGDIVEVEDFENGHLEEVASISDEGRVYFRGGQGASEWPDRLTVRSRAKDKSKNALALKRDAANRASKRSASRGWSAAKETELEPFRVSTKTTIDEIKQFRSVIDSAKDEQPIQKFIEEHPQILASLLGGHSRFVVPQPQMAGIGGKRIPDFLIADVDSRGVNWVFVELETPQSPVALKEDNQLEQHARKGVSQVGEWRQWVQDNLSQARLPRREGGLGLPDIRPDSKGIVFVGRRALLSDNAKIVRLAMSEEQRIDVHTYDYLLERLEGAVRFRGPSGLNQDLISQWDEDDDDWGR